MTTTYEAEQIVSRICTDVGVCLSAPRLTFTDNVICQIAALVPLGIDPDTVTGPFWWMEMELAMEKHIAAGAKYLLAIDQDSVFTASDIALLYATMEDRDDLDGLAAVEIRRDDTKAIMSRTDEEGYKVRNVPWESLRQDTMPIRTSHFGLTLLRAERVNSLPKPWFKCEPDKDGRWSEDRTDFDMWFWIQWEKAGYILHSANRVHIGHMQLVGTWPDRNLRPVHKFMSDFRKSGPPAETIW